MTANKPWYDLPTCPGCGVIQDMGRTWCPDCGTAYDAPVRPRLAVAPAPPPPSALSNPVVIVGGVIGVALVAIAVMMFLVLLRDSHGWGDIICHAKFGDPGFGSIWERDLRGDNVCRPAPW